MTPRQAGYAAHATGATNPWHDAITGGTLPTLGAVHNAAEWEAGRQAAAGNIGRNDPRVQGLAEAAALCRDGDRMRSGAEIYDRIYARIAELDDV